MKTCYRCGAGHWREGRTCEKCLKPKLRRVQVNEQGKSLSFREKQVVDLVANGKLNKEIAYALRLSDGTIKVYMSKIFQKVGVTNRTELAVWVIRRRQEEASVKQLVGNLEVG